MDFLITNTLDKVMLLQNEKSFKLAAGFFFFSKDNPFYNIQLRKYNALGI